MPLSSLASAPPSVLPGSLLDELQPATARHPLSAVREHVKNICFGGSMLEFEPILQCLGEGEAITLEGARLPDGTWAFRRRGDARGLRGIVSDESLEGIELVNLSNAVVGIKNGLALLGTAWPRLSPRFVHSEFADEIGAAVARGRPDAWALGEWRRWCDVPEVVGPDRPGE